MAKCGCSSSCGCVLAEGDNISISGTGSANAPYIITADLGAFEDFTGVLTVNGQHGPDVVLAAYDVNAVSPMLILPPKTASAVATIGAMNIFKAGSTAGITATLPVLTDDDCAKAKRIIIEKDPTDTAANPIAVSFANNAQYPAGSPAISLTGVGDNVHLQAVKVGATRYWALLSQTRTPPTVAATADTGWVSVTPAAGWTLLSGAPLQARMIGTSIMFQGGIINSTFTGGYTTGATLPAAVPPPLVVRGGAGIVDGATIAAGRGARVNVNGTIQFATSTAINGLPYKLDDITYRSN